MLGIYLSLNGGEFMTTVKASITEEDFNKATDQGARLLARGPLATSVRYSLGRIHVELDNGCAFVFPASHAQTLSGAKVADLRQIEINAAGLGLHWPSLDADLWLPSLIKGVLGTKQWMAQIGAVGGQSSSAAKSSAARANGKRGGRPKKHKA